MTFRPMPLMSFLMIPGLALLIWLGTWQWTRYQEKISQPERPPVEALVSLDGELEDGPFLWIYTTYDGQTLWRGYRVLDGCVAAPDMQRDCGSPIFVNMLLLHAIEPTAEPAGVDVDLSGTSFRLISDFPQGFLRPTNQPERRRWYTPDAPQMAEDLGLENAGAAMLAEPLNIRVVGIDQAGDEHVREIENPYANPALADDLPPSRHLGYALTWYGLALAMIGVYFALHVARGRLKFGKRAE